MCIGLVCASSAGLAQAPPQAVAVVVNLKGQEIGKARLTQTASGLLIDINLSGIAPGEHGFHIHEIGICDPADGFKSAGGHFNPNQHQHGYMAEHGPHAGDMPNLFSGADGEVRANVLNTKVTLTDGPGNLLDGNGSAIVVHADPDDYNGQPAGNAGVRIACGVIEKP
jgi:Cu-Zn family superoxide dismutase